MRRRAADRERPGTGRKRLVGRTGDCARLLDRSYPCGCTAVDFPRAAGCRHVRSGCRPGLVPARHFWMSAPAYAELHCISNFTFLRGASHPAELVHQAAKLGYGALALTDECSVAGVV